MSAPVTIEEAQARLPELIAQLVPGEELVITQNDQPVANEKQRETGQPVVYVTIRQIEPLKSRIAEARIETAVA